MLRYFGISFDPRPARRHHKIGIVERKNSVIRTFTQRICKDVSFFTTTRGIDFDPIDILSRSTFLSNVLYGSKSLSSFEMARGYTPSITGLPQSKLSEAIITAHQEQSAKRALRLLDKDHTPHTLTSKDLMKNDKVYYFKKGPKFGTWETAFVREATQHFAMLSSLPNHLGKPIRAAYEDIRKAPASTLLQELDEMEFLFPRSYSITDEEALDMDLPPQPPKDNLFPDLAAEPVPDDSPPPAPSSSNGDLPDTNIASNTEVQALLDEESLWNASSSLLATSLAPKSNRPTFDIGPRATILTSYLSKQSNWNDLDINSPTLPQDIPSNDVGSTHLLSTPTPAYKLESSEQEVLREIQNVIGTDTVSEAKLEFAPRWIVDKAIKAEMENYKDAHEEVHISSIPPQSNIISSHHFFLVKRDAEEGKLKLKCRLVPHGNRDKEKDSVRKDSATAQFPIIRLVLSLAAILRFSIASIDVKKAYLQAGNLPRDIYVRPPPGWASSSNLLWKLLSPAYGITESGRLWQLAVEKWMSSIGMHQIPGLPQFFVTRNNDHSIALALAKVVDDFILAGSPKEINSFYAKLSSRFTVGSFVTDNDIVYNRLHIHQSQDYSITFNMTEYLQSIKPIPLDRLRRKQRESKCTPQEFKQFLGLTGSLNFLGHGTLPQAAFAASHLQQRVGHLCVADLDTANKMLNEIQSLSPVITFKSSSCLQNPSYIAFSDASQGNTSYGQTGYISGLFLPAGGVDDAAIFHAIDWLSCKQHRVSFSSIGAEILAAATSTDRGSLMAERLQSVYASSSKLPFVLTVDSKGLYSTITTLHEGSDYRLRPTVCRIRDSYESGEISVMQWIPGKQNIADALTKRNFEMYRKLNDIMAHGLIHKQQFQHAHRLTSN